MVSKEPHEQTVISGAASVSGRYRVQPHDIEGVVSHRSDPVVLHTVRVSVTKTALPACIRLGEAATYTIVICNESDLPIADVQVLDAETAGWFSVSALRLNGETIPEGDLSTGVFVGTLPAGARATVTFEARADTTAPAAPVSAAVVQYRYMEGDEWQTGSARSNQAEVLVLHPDIRVWKTADKTVLPPDGRPVGIRLFVQNTGNVRLTEVAVWDRLPAGMTYLSGSTCIDGGPPTEKNPEQGLALGKLEPGQTVEIHYLTRSK